MQHRSHQLKERRRLNAVALRLSIGAIVVAVGFLAAMFTGRSLLAQEIEPANVDLAAISDYLNNELQTTTGEVSFLVVFKDQLAADDLNVSAAGVDATRETRLASAYAALTEHAARTQAPLIAWLDAQGIDYRPFYIINMIEVTGDAELAAALRRRPEVDRLIANPQIEQSHALAVAATPSLPSWLHTIDSAQATEVAQSVLLPYGLSVTGAVELWALGYTGEGITVASQDTGVEWTHPALQPRYRGWNAEDQEVQHVYNWYDAWDGQGRPARCDPDLLAPCDDHSHGTHTVGTMLGNATETAAAVGMAPDAQWIGCRNMLAGVGTPTSYTACFEFFLAPYPQDGDPMTDGDPTLAPHIINNSWGCPPSEGCDAGSLRQIVETVRAAGIFVVASAGNDGYGGCSTVNDPIAIYDATFTVGAHGEGGGIAGFSSRGTVTIDGSERTKPDISAPGVNVLSSTLNGRYSSSSGTSMASPHVAGAAALLWSAVPDLIGQIDLTEQALIKSATPVVDFQCSKNSERPIPNNVFGYGRLNALAAVELASQPASVQIQMSDQEKMPMAGLTVSLTDSLTGYGYDATTAADGTAVFAKVFAGDYRVQILEDSETLVEETLAVELGEMHEASFSEALNQSYLPVVLN